MGYGKCKGVLHQSKDGDTDVYSTHYVFNVLTDMYKKYEWTYLIAGQEYCPSNGRPHVDFYYEQETPRKISTERKKFVKAFRSGFGDLRIAKGKAGENLDYSSKDNNEFLLLGEPTSQGQRNDLEELSKGLLGGQLTAEKILTDQPMIYHQYGRTMDKLEDIHLRNQFRTEMPDAVWIHGSTGVGKSHEALHDYTPSTHYLWRNDNGWQDGYRQQKTVVINDFRGEIPYNELLQLIDKWPYFLRRRNREPMPFTSPKIIITSSLPPEQVYIRQLEKRDSIDQLKRRIRVKEIYDKPPPKIAPIYGGFEPPDEMPIEYFPKGQGHSITP